jgi:hypothetical protein
MSPNCLFILFASCIEMSVASLSIIAAGHVNAPRYHWPMDLSPAFRLTQNVNSGLFAITH